MKYRIFDRLRMSAVWFRGGGIGQVWGATDRDEALATVAAAVADGIISLAPMYGNGEAERVVGAAYRNGCR